MDQEKSDTERKTKSYMVDLKNLSGFHQFNTAVESGPVAAEESFLSIKNIRKINDRKYVKDQDIFLLLKKYSKTWRL